MLNIFKQGHPKGLFLLFFVEMWERFSFYGMRALIVLYMVEVLMYSTQKAGNIYGLYTGLVYLTPLIGGYLADKYIGQRRCITFGAIFMVLGLFLLAWGDKDFFIISLVLMIIANGFFKSNISSVLGLLYGDNNEKKDSAFTIFYMGINLGAFLSPLICGTLAVKLGYEYGFLAAGIGMLVGLFLYKTLENKLLGDCGTSPIAKKLKNYDEEATETSNKGVLPLIYLMLFTIPFWVCFEQAGSSLTLFAQYQTNRSFWGHEIPTGYFQSLNPLFIITLAPLISILWENLRKKSKEPSSVEKFLIALFLMAVSFCLLALGAFHSKTDLVSPFWLIFGYLIMTIAELCLSPIGLSLVSKLAPKKMLSLTMGCWFLTSFIGNLVAGIWGGNYETLGAVNLFLVLACLAFLTFIILLPFVPYFNTFIENKKNISK